MVTRRAVELPADVDWEAVTADYGDTGWCTADDPGECTVVEGSGPHVLLLGDSQAQSLVPMFRTLAEEHDLTLSLNVVEGCLWQEGLYNTKSSDEEQDNCRDGPGRLVRRRAPRDRPGRGRGDGPAARRRGRVVGGRTPPRRRGASRWPG